MSAAISFLVIFLVLLLYLAQEQEAQPTGCQKTILCQNLGNISFPFFTGTQTECRLWEVDCENKDIKLWNESHWYDVVTINQSNNTIEIRDKLLQERLNFRSCDSFKNFTLASSLPAISFTILNANATFFRCTNNSELTPNYFSGYHNYTEWPGYSLYYRNPCGYDYRFFHIATLPPTCSVIQAPVRSDIPNLTSDPFQFMTADLLLEYHVSGECSKCHFDGGNCSSTNKQ